MINEKIKQPKTILSEIADLVSAKTQMYILGFILIALFFKYLFIEDFNIIRSSIISLIPVKTYLALIQLIPPIIVPIIKFLLLISSIFFCYAAVNLFFSLYFGFALRNLELSASIMSSTSNLVLIIIGLYALITYPHTSYYMTAKNILREIPGLFYIPLFSMSLFDCLIVIQSITHPLTDGALDIFNDFF